MFSRRVCLGIGEGREGGEGTQVVTPPVCAPSNAPSKHGFDGSDTGCNISLMSKVQAGFELPLSICMNFSVTHIFCFPAPTNKMLTLKPSYCNSAFHNNVSLHFELKTKAACIEKPQWCHYNLSGNKQQQKSIFLK